MNKDVRINKRIRVREVRLIDADSNQLGIVSIQDALKTADDSGLDLVEVAPTAKPPVCRIMDFGKYKYQLSKKQSNKKGPDVKEIKVRPRIDDHDLQLKMRNLIKFLDSGHKAKVSMFFRGRERGRPELGMKVFDKVIATLNDNYTIGQRPRHEGNSITMIVMPKSAKDKGGK